MDTSAHRAAPIAMIIVVNMIWWMLMIAAIGLGATHLNSCPVQPYIPIYLIVMGASSVLALIFTYSSRSNKDGAVYALSLVFMTFLHIFNFAWLIAGTVWVYSVYPPDYTGTGRFCHKTTYLFAFVFITVLWVTVALMFICGGCFALLTCCTTVVASRHLLPNQNSFYGATSGFHDPSVRDV